MYTARLKTICIYIYIYIFLLSLKACAGLAHCRSTTRSAHTGKMDKQCNCLHRAAAHEVYTLCDLQLSTMPALLEKLEAALTTASVSPRSKENVTIQDWASGPASRTGWGH